MTWQTWMRRRPPLPAGQETALTAGSALLWYGIAMLLHLENLAHDSWDPDYPSARPFFLLAYATGASLLLTWALRGLAAGRLRAFVDRVVVVRAAAVLAAWAALAVTAAIP